MDNSFLIVLLIIFSILFIITIIVITALIIKLNNKINFGKGSQIDNKSLDIINSNLNAKLSDLDRKLFDLQGQKEITKNIYNSVDTLEKIMTNQKTRGLFGEYQLEKLMIMMCGSSSKIFSMQYTLKSRVIADCVLHLPGSDKILCIDSKFPLENYKKLTSSNITKNDIDEYKKAFKKDVKKHIDDIAKKYITPESSNYAVMFIPSEAIYSYILSKEEEIFEFALNNKVALVSPTTLIGTIYTIIDLTKDYNRAEKTEEIEKLIKEIYSDISQLNKYYENLRKCLTITIPNHIEKIDKQMNKITNKSEIAFNGFEDDVENDKNYNHYDNFDDAQEYSAYEAKELLDKLIEKNL